MSFNLQSAIVYSLLILAAIIDSSAAKYNGVKTENAGLERLLNINHMGYDGFPAKLLALLSDAEENTCVLQLRALSQALTKNETWALQMFDAWGKIPSGLLYGNFMEMGNFDECIGTSSTLSDNSHLVGKYCLSSIPLSGENAVSLRVGICMPTACSANQFDAVLKLYLQTHFDMNVNETTMLVEESSCTLREKPPLRPLDWVAIALLILLGLFIVLSTCYDILATHYGKPLKPLLISFSLRSNVRQLFHISAHHNQPHIIPCLNGIRSMSIIWIVFIHCNLFLLISPNINAVDVDDWMQSPFAMFYETGTIAVDTFFFLSGLLLITVSFREMEKNKGKINVLMMYAHRYLRLTPVLAVAVLLFMTLYQYVGSGPLWNNMTGAYKLCDETWWATLLYVQNYAAAGKMCLGHSWYLAADFQLYLVSPLVLIALWKWNKKGIAGLLVVGLLLVACLFSMIMINEFSFFEVSRNLGESSDAMPITLRNTEKKLGTRPSTYCSVIYYSTHTRASPWIIGIVFGYYLRNNSHERTTKLSKLSIVLGWTFSLALLFTVIFSILPKAQFDAKPLTALESAFYMSFTRIAWPLALCWIVFACVNGYAGPVNKFLSWGFWQPVAKLSYCIYIWHLLVVNANAARIRTNTYFSDYDVTLRFWSDFGISLLVSVCMYLSVEAPMLIIDKVLLPKTKPKNTTENAATTTAVTISKQNLCD